MGTLVGRHSVGLGDDRNDVDFLVQPLHELNVERLESVAGRRDEVQAAVHSRVGLARFAVHTGLRVQVLFISENKPSYGVRVICKGESLHLPLL